METRVSYFTFDALVVVANVLSNIYAGLQIALSVHGDRRDDFREMGVYPGASSFHRPSETDNELVRKASEKA